jgi:hypothetical protein
MVTELTGNDAGLTRDEQIRIVLREMIRRGGEAKISELYMAVDAVLRPRGMTLSHMQGKATLRNYVNKVAVQAGYICPYDTAAPRWRITPAGRKWAGG